MPKPVTMDYLRSTKKPVRVSTWICLHEDLVSQEEGLQNEVNMAKARASVDPSQAAVVAESERLEGELSALHEEIRKPGNSIKFTFQSIGAKNYDKLQSLYPATDQQREELKGRGMDPDSIPYDVSKFAAALIAKCCVEPEMTLEFVTDEIQNCEDGTWSTGDFNSLYSTAVDANLRSRSVNLGNGSGRTRSSKKS